MSEENPDVTQLATLELGRIAQTALERLRDPFETMTPAERTALNDVRISVIGEMGRREAASRQAAQTDTAQKRMLEIEREMHLHAAIAGGADTEGEREAESNLRKHRVAQLENEAANLKRIIES